MVNGQPLYSVYCHLASIVHSLLITLVVLTFVVSLTVLTVLSVVRLGIHQSHSFVLLNYCVRY